MISVTLEYSFGKDPLVNIRSLWSRVCIWTNSLRIHMPFLCRYYQGLDFVFLKSVMYITELVLETCDEKGWQVLIRGAQSLEIAELTFESKVRKGIQRSFCYFT